MKIHFIGIGGIGVSALGQYYLSKGHKVSGSDLMSSEITDFLKNKGAEVFIGHHSGKNLSDSDLVIYSPAVKSDNPEFEKAKELKIKIQSYPQALGDLTKEYFTIAVSGTHGKSTTTAMISLVLTEAGFDPTVIVGTKLKEFGNTNFRLGKSKYLIIEADEWNASFLNYWPKIIVLTNIEEEHLDYYKDLKHILKTYKEYVSHLAEDGALVANQDDNNILKLDLDFKGYSLKQKEVLEKILQIPGEYNIYNALASLTVARILNIPDKVSLKALSQYKGTWRRFEIIKAGIGDKKITIVSDYAHHPTEARAVLKAVREKFPDQKIWCVFQPHQYQRTFYLFNEFVKVFSSSLIDNLIITDIYDVAGRETNKTKEKVSSKKLAQAIPGAVYLAKNDIIDYLKKELKHEEILVIMGAGDIYNLIDEFST